MWLAPDAIATWEAVGVDTRGGQRQYSDFAIATALTLRLIFHLPLRQTEGFLTSIFRMLDLDLSAPDHTTLSRRGQHLDLPLRRAPAGAGLHLLVDSTGLSIVGEGEWAAAKHGGRRMPPTMRSASTRPPVRVARPSWFRRRGRPTCLDTARGRARVIARSWRSRREDGDAGSRCRAIMGRPAWSTRSSGTRRSSETAFERAVPQGGGLRSTSRATS